MTDVHILAIALAKRSFQVCATDPGGAVLFNRTISRAKLEQLFGTQPPCIVAMEACATVAQRATSVIAQPAGNLGQATYAEFARLIAGGARGAEVRRVFTKAVLIAFAAAIPFVALCAFFGRTFARWIGGPEFSSAGDIMICLFVARSIPLVSPPASSALVALGRPGLSFGANLISSIGLLPLLPLLVMSMELPGAGLFCLVQVSLGTGMLAILFWRESHSTRAPGRSVSGGRRSRPPSH